MPRKRKSGPRTKSGRLSRAYKRNPELRDQGTPEFLAKRAYLINGADPQLAATASGILLANGHLTQGQHIAALRYARLHSLVYGRPWSYVCPLARELDAATRRTDVNAATKKLMLAKAELKRLEQKGDGLTARFRLQTLRERGSNHTGSSEPASRSRSSARARATSAPRASVQAPEPAIDPSLDPSTA